MQLTPLIRTPLPSVWNSPIEEEFSSLQRSMNDLMSNFMGRGLTSSPQVWGTEVYPAVDVRDEGNMYCIEAELPGMKETDIDLDLHDNILTIKGEKKSESKKMSGDYQRVERRYGAFQRDIPFSDEIKTDKVSAKLCDGILKVELKKKDNGKKNHIKIPLKS